MIIWLTEIAKQDDLINSSAASSLSGRSDSLNRYDVYANAYLLHPRWRKEPKVLRTYVRCCKSHFDILNTNLDNFEVLCFQSKLALWLNRACKPTQICNRWCHRNEPFHWYPDHFVILFYFMMPYRMPSRSVVCIELINQHHLMNYRLYA